MVQALPVRAALGGITGQPMDGPPDPKKLMTGIVCAVILVFTLALLIKGLSVTTAGGALLFGVLAGIGIVGAVGLPVSLYNAQGVKLFFIDYGLSLFTIVMDSFILVLMK